MPQRKKSQEYIYVIYGCDPDSIGARFVELTKLVHSMEEKGFEPCNRSFPDLGKKKRKDRMVKLVFRRPIEQQLQLPF